jgi:hypothetical protein
MSGVLVLLAASAALAVFIKLCCTAADEIHERSSRRWKQRMSFSRSRKHVGARHTPDDSDPISQLTLGELRQALAADINKAMSVVNAAVEPPPWTSA